jgi:nitroreductase
VDLFEALAKRHSVRCFDPDQAVSDEEVSRLLESACLAPSAGNVQPWRFYPTRRDDLKAELAAAALGQSFLREAPVVVVVCADLEAHSRAYGRRGVELYAIQDCAAAIQNMLLAATALGLAACWVGAFREAQAARALGLPAHIRPMALIPVGHESGHRSQPRKMGPQQMTTWL